MIIIDDWVGRLGNNIVQILNAVCIGIHHNCHVKFPKHQYFNKRHIVIGEKEKEKIYVGDCFFRCHMTYPSDIYDNYKCIQILRDNHILKSNPFDVGIDELLIHVRSGDIFCAKPHLCYMQPPLVFYKQIIALKEWQKIIILSEDTKNPVINELLKIPKTKLEICSLERTINLLISHKNVVFGLTSFSPALLLFNTNLENIYFPDYILNFEDRYTGVRPSIELQEYLIDYLKCQKNIIPLGDYVERMGGFWGNTEFQQKLMLNYEITS